MSATKSLVLLCSFATVAVVVSPCPAKTNVYGVHGDVFEALSGGAEIDLFKVLSQTSTSAAGVPIQSGRIQLSLVESICGPARSAVTLPYSRASGPIKSDFSPIWPNPALMNAQLVLCVWLPRATDSAAGDVGKIDGAATDVFPVGDERAPEIGVMREVCRLQQMREGKELTAALGRAVLDNRDILRRYALEAVAARLLPDDLKGGSAIIASRIAREPQVSSAPGEFEAIMVQVQRLGLSQRMSMTLRRQLAASIVGWIADGSLYLARAAVPCLGTIVRQTGFGAAGALVKPDVRLRANKAIRRLRDDQSSSVRAAAEDLLNWMNKGRDGERAGA
jgi:hypothetical protein